MRCVIIDDNPLDQQVLTKLIASDADLELMGTFENPIAAIAVLKNSKPDLIFLDVEMPGMTGIEFLEAAKEVPQIIMVTSHKEYALEAFENEVTDFLVKPPAQERFQRAVDKARQIHEWVRLSSDDDRFIFIRSEGNDVKVVLNDILYVEAMSDYVRVQCVDAKYMVLSTMKSIATKLPEEQFTRVHRSFIVNRSRIDSFSGNELQLGDSTVPVSRSHRSGLKALLS